LLSFFFVLILITPSQDFWISQLLNMADINEEPKTGHSSNASDSKLDEKLQYEETTTFSGPLPNKDVAFVSTASDSDEDGEALKKNPFLDPDVAEHWTGVYEKSSYECRAVFDPSFTWTEEEERKLVRRLDWRVCLWAVRTLLFGYGLILANSPL
jgi:hypothetical protein